MLIISTLTESVCAFRRYVILISICISSLLVTSYNLQAQLTLTSGQSVSLNSTVTYPSASISGANKVFINMPARDQLSLQVTDITGRTLVRQKIMAEKGDNIFTLNISRLTNGVYYVQVFNNNGLYKTIMTEKRSLK